MNKKNIFPFRSPGDASLLSGGLSALLGLVVLAGWHTLALPGLGAGALSGAL